MTSHSLRESAAPPEVRADAITPAAPPPRGRRLIVGVAAAAVLVSGGGLAAASMVKSPRQAAADAGAPAPQWLTAPVVREVLRSTIIARGTVQATTTVQLTQAAASSQGAATQVVTAVRVSAGDTVKQGQVLLDVSGRPVFALAGTIPPYRDLKPSASGADVTQLQDALARLGFPSGDDRRGYFGPATKSAVTLFYQHLGYDVPTTGGPGDQGDAQALQSAQNAVDTAQRAVDDMQRQIDSAPTRSSTAASTGSSTESGKAASTSQEPLSTQMGYLRKALVQAQQAQATLIAGTGPMVPMAEVMYLPSFPARVTAVAAKVGAAPSPAALTVSAGALGVVAQLPPDESALVKPGLAVDLAAEGLGATATARVTTVGALSTSAAGSDAGAGTGAGASAGGGSASGEAGQAAQVPAYVPVRITPDTALSADWAGQDVRVTIVAAATPQPVLVVPVAAVSSGADGTTAVSILVRSRGAMPTRVPVTTGLSADGFVEVSPVVPNALRANDDVVIGQ